MAGQDEMKRRVAERQKDLAIIKASNEMLEQAKETYMRHVGGEVGDAEEKILSSLDRAIGENEAMAKSYYGASRQDIASATYHGPSAGEIRKYEYRLAKKKMTHEQMAMKEMATVSAGPNRARQSTSSDGRRPERVRRVRGAGYTEDPNAVNARYEEKDVIVAKKFERAIDETPEEWKEREQRAREQGLKPIPRHQRRNRERRAGNSTGPNSPATVTATAVVGGVSVGKI